MNKYIYGFFLTVLAILLNKVDSAGQLNDEVKYCQISASYSYNTDLTAESFSFGKQHEKAADSLFKACKVKYAFERKNNLYLTDALNYFHGLGWKLITVYTVMAENPNLHRYYYVLKRE